MERNKQAAPSAMWKVREEIVRRQIGDVCAFLDLRSGAFYTLNETASLFWKLIEEQTTIEDICARVKKQYEISQEEVLEDLVAFIDFFAKEQLLIRQH